MFAHEHLYIFIVYSHHAFVRLFEYSSFIVSFGVRVRAFFLAKWSKMNDFLHLQKDITFEIGLNDDAWINILSTHFLYWKHKNIKSWFEFNGKYIFGRRIISPMAWSGHLISLVKIVLFLICDKCRHLRTKGNLNS